MAEAKDIALHAPNPTIYYVLRLSSEVRLWRINSIVPKPTEMSGDSAIEFVATGSGPTESSDRQILNIASGLSIGTHCASAHRT